MRIRKEQKHTDPTDKGKLVVSIRTLSFGPPESESVIICTDSTPDPVPEPSINKKAEFC
jgi:hypothetical protein